MIECVFTIDYEIYGNGQGSLRELVYDPVERLMATFRKWNSHFMPFVEIAELEMIEANGTDPAIDQVKNQIRDFHRQGFELGLHLHPQWYNAKYEDGKWQLNYKEYNLCTLPRERIIQIIDRAVAYFRQVLDAADFTPLSFRAGNWLLQPTPIVAKVLAERGIKVDTSVFKGGMRHQQKLDYRQALRNGYYWRFADDTNVPSPNSILLELPIYTQMVPTWKMLTAKRIGQEQKASSTAQTYKTRLYRLMDFLRLWQPLKFDFCRMTLNELTRMMDGVIKEDQKDPESFKPIVAIGHTKELVDFGTVESFLAHLRKKEIPITTFKNVYDRCV
jgi:hypothetical protein